jgi:glycosyltransferase involved in cell wall biosynthesis/tetratricopeptide (TPR) repeat protein
MENLESIFDNIIRVCGKDSANLDTVMLTENLKKTEWLGVLTKGFAKRAYQSGRLQAGLDAIDLLQKIHGPNFNLLIVKGELLELSGKIREAAVFYDAAKSLIPGHGMPFTKKLLLGLRDIRGCISCRSSVSSAPFISMDTLGLNGRFGNQLFQYAFLKCYSLSHNLNLKAPDWLGRYVFGLDDDWCGLAVDHTPSTVNALLEKTDKPELQNKNITGFFNEHTAPFRVYKEVIQNLFKPAPRFSPVIEQLKRALKPNGEELIALHLRRGDFGYGSFWVAPEEWYLDWVDSRLRKNPKARLYISTDDRATIQAFSKYSPITISDLRLHLGDLDFLLDFYALAFSDSLAISNSTFSFFAAMLNQRGQEFMRPAPSERNLIPFDPWNSQVLLKHKAEEVGISVLQEKNHRSNIVSGTSNPFLFFLSPRANYRDPILYPNETFCGPDTKDEIVGGRRRCVKTPAKPFDAPKFFAEQGITEMPDLVLVKADATGRTFPRNLGAFKCPKVLLVGVTHFLPQPIRKVIEYAKSEPFDFIIMDVTRHHAHWFREAGLKNVHWLPALEYNPLVRPVKKHPGHRLTFVGQAGAHHPFRKSVLERLKSDGFPIEVLQAPQAKAADIYSDSLATLNLTLNGDINMRFFEGLAAGGFLLCDRLPEWSGLDRLFSAGEHFDLFGSYGELAEKLRYYFSKPDLVHRIKSAGQAKLMEFHSPEVKMREFHDLIFNGIENPLYALDEEARTTVVVSKKLALELLPAYEFFQELHRNRSRLVFYCAEGDGERVRRFVDLPRVECRRHAEWEAVGQEEGGNFMEERILHIGEGEDSAALEAMFLRNQPRWVFAPNGDPGVLAGWGFVLKEVGVFEYERPVLGMVRRARAMGGEEARILLTPCVDLCVNYTEALEVADACEGAGLPEARKEALMRAVFLNRDCVPALIQLADLSLDAGALVDATLLLSEANRVAPLADAIAPVFRDLMERVAKSPDIVNYKRALQGGEHPQPETLRRVLVVTNLFPPQEMGGYGRKIWEFANGLKARGHTVAVLTSNSDYLGKKPDESEFSLESVVRRELTLMGEWRNGTTRATTDAAGQRKMGESNARLVLEAARRFSPDVVLLGNLDFLGVELLHGLLKRGIPVIHSLGNQTPWYQAVDSIDSPKYVIAPASDWLGHNLLSLGYTAPRLETVYPGARVDRFYRHFLPDARKLRIAFAGLVMPYKGPQLLLDALVKLHQAEIGFEAEFAGDSIDQEFVEKLRAAAAAHGIGDRVRFSGFLSRTELSALFARSNVLVFPTLVPEAFGISQVEAMAGGLIVLTSGTGGTTEVVRHLEDGIVFDPKDSASLAKWLARLANDPLLRKHLQAQARERALDFSVTSSVVVIERIVESLLNKDAGELSEPTRSGRSEGAGKPFPPASAKLEFALSAFNAGRLAEAEDVCRELLQADEKCAVAWNLMAQMAALNANLESAGDFGALACELEPGNAGFVRFLAEVNLGQGKLEPAEQQVRRALEMAPDSPEGLVLLGRILAEKDDKHAALEAFEDALRMRNDYAEGFSHYAMALQKFGRWKDAISRIRKACSLAPNSVEFQTILAMLLEQNARWEDALKAYGDAARINPDVGFVWFRQGKLLNGRRRYAEAIPILEKAISKPGVRGEYFYEMGLALDMSKRIPEALEYYNKAIAAGFNTAKSDASSALHFVP